MNQQEARKYYESNLEDFRYVINFSKPLLEHLLKELKEVNGRAIHDAVKCRIKELDSALEKCERRGLEIYELTDIAGVRIICPFRDDVYKVYDAIRQMPFLVIKQRKDYIESPKENGYQSLHLIMEVPIHSTTQRSKVLPMEIQIRTKAMDLWSSIDHIIKYKNSTPSPEATEKLRHLADTLEKFEAEAIKLRDFSK